MFSLVCKLLPSLLNLWAGVCLYVCVLHFLFIRWVSTDILCLFVHPCCSLLFASSSLAPSCDMAESTSLAELATILTLSGDWDLEPTPSPDSGPSSVNLDPGPELLLPEELPVR